MTFDQMIPNIKSKLPVKLDVHCVFQLLIEQAIHRPTYQHMQSNTHLFFEWDHDNYAHTVSLM